MKHLFLEPSSDILSDKMARANLDGTTPEISTLTEEGNIISPSVRGKTYSLELKPGHLFCCSKTGIKFQVKSQVTIEYELEYGKDYIKQIKDSGYELVGPLFNITVEPDVVSTVHLPHYLYLEGLGRDKSSIKYGHFKDEKVHFKTPTRINSSYIVLENPTFSRAGAMIRSTSFLTLRKRSIQIEAKVVLYFRIMSPHNEEIKEYRTHLYLVPCKNPDLQKLDDLKEKHGFIKIDKPASTILIAGETYKVNAEGPNPSVIPESLKFKQNNPIKDLPFAEINVGGSATSISLKLATAEKSVWTGALTRADLEDLSVMVKPIKQTDESGEHFVMKYRAELIQRIISIKPVIDDLCKEKILAHEDYDTVCSAPTPQDKMRTIYDYVSRLGEKEKDFFYEVLKKHNPGVIKDLEAKR